jgi:hypothetical protein
MENAKVLSGAEGGGEVTGSMSLSIFTVVVDHKPVIALGCKKHSEAEAICADERIRAKLSSMRSGGKPLLDDFATPLVRLARPDEGRCTTNNQRRDQTTVACQWSIWSI